MDLRVKKTCLLKRKAYHERGVVDGDINENFKTEGKEKTESLRALTVQRCRLVLLQLTFPFPGA